MNVKPLWLAVAVAGMCACGGGAKAPAKPEPAKVVTPEDVVQAANGTVEKYRQAYQVRSVDALAELYSQTVDLVLVHQGQAHHGWNGVAEYLRGLLAGASEVRVKISAVAVTAVGDQGAAVSAEMVRAVSDGVTTVEEKGVLTLTIRRESDRWVIVQEHFSYRPQAP